MAERINFSVRALTTAVAAGKRRTQFYDLRTPGLLFEVTSKGARSFYLYRWVNDAPLRVRLGGFPEMTIEQARNAASRLNGDIAKGIDPRTERQRVRASMTLAELLSHYLETHAKTHKKTWQDDQRQFERYFGKATAERKPDDDPPPFPAWRTRKISTITEADVQSLHTKLGTAHGPYTANRMLALLSAMFNNAKLANPTKGVKRFREQKRERFLYADELPRFFAALADEPNTLIRDFILVAILTGARRANAQAMRWADVHLERATWRIPDAKGGDPITLHLAPAAVRVLATRWQNRDSSPFVFPGRGKTGHLVEPKAAWTKILERAGLAGLRIHDLRRTLGSWQAAGGASLPIIGKSLGHKDGSPATAIYARLNLDPVAQSVNAATAAIGQYMPAGLLPDEMSPQRTRPER